MSTKPTGREPEFLPDRSAVYLEGYYVADAVVNEANSMRSQPDYDEVEKILAAAEEAAINCVHIASVVNPYPPDSMRGEIWSHAFRAAYQRERILTDTLISRLTFDELIEISLSNQLKPGSKKVGLNWLALREWATRESEWPFKETP